MPRELLKGNQAIAEAAIRAGLEAYFGYPITPQTEVLEHLSKRLPELGRTFVQAESEVAAINMVYGAACTGVRVMSTSSSPGVSLMLEGAGFEVTDLGVDAPSSKFVAAVRETNADIVGLSALLSVTMLKMKDVINSFEEAGIRKKVKVIIGGASVSKGFSEEIGADGYAADAGSAVDLSKRLLNIGDR